TDAGETASVVRELEARRTQLERQNRELEGFAYVVSHDLLQPLRSVIDYLELIEYESGSSLTDEAVRWLKSCRKLGGAMSTLITEALEYSQLAAGTTTLVETSC